MNLSLIAKAVLTGALASLSVSSFAALNPIHTWTGNVGLSVDAIGSNQDPVGNVRAAVPVGATVLNAYLYSAGRPYNPTTLAQYNGSGISLAGTTINNFDTLVGAHGRISWDTARADVTSLVQSLTASATTPSFSWSVSEGSLNSNIDGEILAIVYKLPSLAKGTVTLLDGGQATGGETTTINFGAPISDPSASGFMTQLGLGISFSAGGQASTVKINGTTLTTFAGNNDDGLELANGSLITVGGIGDTALSNPASYAEDHELYNLAPFLHTGDQSFSIHTFNQSDDDNIFFASLYTTASIAAINDVPVSSDSDVPAVSAVPAVPEPGTYALMLAGLGALGYAARRNKR